MPRFFARELDLVDDAEHLVVLADEALRPSTSRMCNGVIRRPPLSQATARQALYPLPISPVLPSRTRARYSIFFAYSLRMSVGR